MSQNTYPQLMLDLETMGDTSDAAIVSIAAVQFNIETGETGKTFYERVDLENSMANGGKASARTIKWWLMQNESAKIEFLKSGLPLVKVLDGLIYNFHSGAEVFSKGPAFDMPILKNAFANTHLHYPFNHRLERCVRTYISLNPELANAIPFEGIPHHALHDCYHQIKQVCAVHQSLTLNTHGQHNQVS